MGGGHATLFTPHKGLAQSLLWPSTLASSKEGALHLLLSWAPRRQARSGTGCSTSLAQAGGDVVRREAVCGFCGGAGRA